MVRSLIARLVHIDAIVCMRSLIAGLIDTDVMCDERLQSPSHEFVMIMHPFSCVAIVDRIRHTLPVINDCYNKPTVCVCVLASPSITAIIDRCYCVVALPRVSLALALVPLPLHFLVHSSSVVRPSCSSSSLTYNTLDIPHPCSTFLPQLTTTPRPPIPRPLLHKRSAPRPPDHVVSLL